LILRATIVSEILFDVSPSRISAAVLNLAAFLLLL
jgi:hypothetical protein